MDSQGLAARFVHTVFSVMRNKSDYEFASLKVAVSNLEGLER
jgi:hypothetical protein